MPHREAAPYAISSIPWSRHTLELEVPEHNQVRVERAPIAPDLADPAQAMRDALERPLDYPPLRLALTPDDRVAIVIDEGTPQPGAIASADPGAH